ncbi:hypothetical protein WKI68_18960 [Streptomyces sp. MS1.HAVA.3]|uniref:Uncharacterized protein n=1 Tax=Streptomyces caledonius TaxID=3134107 RepID=A0ABU8U6Y7_9ACTN
MQERVGHVDQGARVALLAAEPPGGAAQGDDHATRHHAGGETRQRGAHQALRRLVAAERAAVGGVQQDGEQRQAEYGHVLLELGETADLPDADDRVHADVRAQQREPEGGHQADHDLGQREHPPPGQPRPAP